MIFLENFQTKIQKMVHQKVIMILINEFHSGSIFRCKKN